MKIKLPNELICCLPKTIQDPIRIGCANDGGYIIPKKLLAHCDDLLSCGLGENWTFDQDWKKLKPNSKIHVYDGTVSENSYKDQLLNEYRSFFPSQATHFQENIGPNNTSFSTAVARLDSERIFLKMDIEGGEFAVLDEILNCRNVIPGIVIEIHFANPLRSQFVNAVQKLQQCYTLVHFHGNNHTVIGPDGSCDCYELTFLRTDLCTDFDDRYDFYLHGLDASNVIGMEDYEFYFANPNSEFDIAILLPSRSRTDALTKSVTSLVKKAEDPSRLQFLFAFDNDDDTGIKHFTEVVQPWLDQQQVSYEAQVFDRLGYEGLNLYYNHLGKTASADWLFIWNDDAVMETDGWDQKILEHNGQFCLLKVHTHNEHPYSIFPIVPRAWFDTTGHFSRHQMIDAELSQMAFMLDVMKVVDIDVTHNQVELTNDSTDPLKPKTRFEGNPENPNDFHNLHVFKKRIEDSDRLADYMKDIGMDTSFWQDVKTAKQDPWVKLRALDINNHMHSFQIQYGSDGKPVDPTMI